MKYKIVRESMRKYNIFQESTKVQESMKKFNKVQKCKNV